MRLLLAEDDPLLGEAIQDGLNFKHYQVDWLTDGTSAAQAIRTESYACIILDIGLPKKSGLDVLDQLRQNGASVPVLILTALDAIKDRVAGLDRGADDYLTKPFDMDELEARIRALIRRSNGRAQPTITLGDIVVYPQAYRVENKGENCNLSRREYALFSTLIEHTGRVFSQSELEDTLYSWDGEVESNAIQVHIHNIRKKIGKNIIRTIRGIGYVIENNN